MMKHVLSLLLTLLVVYSCGSTPSNPAASDAGKPVPYSFDGTILTDGAPTSQNKDAGLTAAPATWVTVKPGAFLMGSPTNESCRDADETSHKVNLTRAFVLQQTEVTQKQFTTLMGYNPSFHAVCGDDCPVEWVSWHEAASYCNRLSAVEGRVACYSCKGAGAGVTCQRAGAPGGACKGYRLPTEAEWEYAARAGSTAALYAGGIYTCMGKDSTTNTIAWFKSNSGGGTHAVQLKQANAWKLSDMSGNVYEWTDDWYATDLGPAAVVDPTGPAAGTERVYRGGAWYYNAEHARSANRERFAPSKRFTFLGFRCARTQ
jgi:formylglycine-generating enzyme required for sulfatase activity